MQKASYYFFGLISVITGISSMYFFFTGQYNTNLVGLIFECCISTVLFIMLEPRPRRTREECKYDDATKARGLGILIMIAIAAVMLMFLSSCSTSGYGCHGNQSWKQMTKRINRP